MERIPGPWWAALLLPALFAIAGVGLTAADPHPQLPPPGAWAAYPNSHLRAAMEPFPTDVFDPVGKQYLAWVGGRAIYKLNRDTWVWTKIIGRGDDPGPQYNVGTFGRFQFVPKSYGLIVVSSVDDNVFYFQLGAPPTGPTTPPPSPSGPDIPDRTWVLLPLPPQHGSPSAANKTPAAGLANHDKHVSLAWNPDNGKIYFEGGDYFGLSYRQETWSLDVKARLSVADPAAGWTLEYPHCGPSTQVQPKGPDFVGWTWDPSRHVFWMIPGEMQPRGAWSGMLCPGETESYTTEGNLLFKHIMQFDPVTKKWADYDQWNGSESWFAVYDPKTDTIVHDAHGYRMGVYDIKAKTRATYSYRSPSGPDPEIAKTIWAADLAGRRIFMPDSLRGNLYRWDMDARKLTLIGPSLCGPAPSDDRGYAVWDSNAKVMIQSCYGGGAVYAYHPDEKPPRWEDLSKLPIRGKLNPSLGSPNGVQFNGVAFDPVNNWIVGLGWQGIWLFRYGPVTRTPVPSPKQ